MTIICRNIHADLPRECHFSNHSAKRDQYSPQIIGTDFEELVEFQTWDLWPLFGCRMRMRISGRRWHKFVSRTIFDSMVVQDYAEQRTIPAALLRASVLTPQSA